MSLFSGLDKFGLTKLEKMEVYEEKAPQKTPESNDKKEEVAQAPTKTVAETDYLFDKSNVCPVCENEFRTKMVRSGRVKRVSTDMDLRPKFQNVDCTKYDAVVCPRCGYAALSRFFKFMTPAQAKLIKDNISANFQGLPSSGDTYSYDESIARHKLALANTVIKKAVSSERAYTCLKTAWQYRGKAESLPSDMPDREKIVAKLEKEELELLKNAYAGFGDAFSKETFPMCGMDELTVTYLMAELARRVGKYEESSRWVSRVLTSKAANERIKDKARDIKELLNQVKSE